MGLELMYPVGSTAACRYAGEILRQSGIGLVDHPAPEVTHLLLDVPSFDPGGMLRGGGNLKDLLRMLPPGITVIGGNLEHPALAGYRKLDLLKEEGYLAQNAAITAECALQVAAQHMEVVFSGCPVLVIGWGRIGKCLSLLLKGMGAEASIAARKEADRAMAKALGFGAVDTASLDFRPYRVVFNTVPYPILHKEGNEKCHSLLIELASKPGLAGDSVVIARGLPGIYAPESSGRLIAETILQRFREGLE